MDEVMEAFCATRQRLGLSPCDPPTSLERFVFVSIDLEFDSKCVTQLGISTFDPQALAKLEGPVSTEYPISSTLYATQTSKFRERRRKPSHFGGKYLLTSEELQPILTKTLAPLDEQGQSKDVILVGHNIASDLREILKLSGLDICQSIPSVVAVLDTQLISRSILDLKNWPSLKRLMLTLKLEYVGLHNAAHDSRYTLRALLMMFCRTTQPQYHDRAQPRLALLEEMARFHRPRERILWCDKPRVKPTGKSDVLDWEHDLGDIGESGLLTLLAQDRA